MIEKSFQTSGEYRTGQRIPAQKTVQISDLHFDPEMQRKLNGRWVQFLLTHWDWMHCDPIKVNVRGDGRMFVINGMHRVKAVWHMGGGFISALVYVGLTTEEEHEIFGAQADFKGLSPLDIFRSRVLAGNEAAKEILMMATETGMAIAPFVRQQNRNQLTCVKSVWDLYHDEGAEHTKRVLHLLADAFNGREKARTFTALDGCSQFLKAHGNDYDRARLIRKIHETPQEEIILLANRYRQTVSTKDSRAFYRALVGLYNRNLRQGYLTPVA